MSTTIFHDIAAGQAPGPVIFTVDRPGETVPLPSQVAGDSLSIGVDELIPPRAERR